ncbi:MAG: M48 family metalloprotease [Vicinamibacterales bacterium]
MRDHRLRICVAAAGIAMAAACATNPATGQRQFSLMSEDQEIQIGREQDAQVRKEMGVYADREVQQYVSDVGQQLAQSSERPNLPWHFTVVDVPAINAFALPGGYIYITRGILPFLQDEAELAGVMGHEIGHVTARHAAQQYSRSTGAGIGLLLGSLFVPQARPFAELGQSGLGLMFLKNGRDEEAQADGLGVKYAARAGWDPSGVPHMLTTLARIEETSDNKGVPNWLQTHPQPEDRVQRVQAAVRQAEAGATRFSTDRDGYLKRLDGLVYGDDPNNGVVRGSRFLHATLRFALDFPAGWDVRNGQTQVVAKEAGGGAFVVMQPVPRAAGRTIEDVALRSMEGAGFHALDGERRTVNTLDAYVGRYQGSIKDMGRVTIRAAHIEHDRTVYLVAGVAAEQAFAGVDPVLEKSVSSFRPLTRAEAEGVRPNRIDFYTARQGDTWQAIAERQGGLAKPSTLAIMNGHPVDDQPRAGERVKVVVAG